ncbi:hypothetical protein [Mesorhizobium sp. Cs1321R2N1]|uniref:hypothetical protein n=1 Tax=Mesorhizobium sp. Cs1321R2N1 TaxID=3015174 RepID=UPI00301CB3F8
MDEETLTVWLDTALLMLGGFVLMTMLMMTVMNPPATANETDGVTAPGNVAVEMQWPGKLDADVDLWVQAPGDVPVGYSNKSGKVFDLLRDDLGMTPDMTDSHHEVAYSRGAPAGEYTVNVHMYSWCERHISHPGEGHVSGPSTYGSPRLAHLSRAPTYCPGASRRPNSFKMRWARRKPTALR